MRLVEAQCAHRKHCYPESPLGSHPTSRSHKIVDLDFSIPFWTFFFGALKPRGPGTHFRTVFATLGPKGPKEPCSRQNFWQFSGLKSLAHRCATSLRAKIVKVAPLQNKVAPKSFQFQKTKCETKCETKSLKNTPKRKFQTLFSCLKCFHRHFLTVLHPQFQTQFFLSQRESAGMATLKNCWRTAIFSAILSGITIPTAENSLRYLSPR